mmetsp:Transcript_67513/g.185105  ORF Transcript_67513/g.185105 Transcript_67513/m.185105 type:complete len:683 (-) Transcript_67513:372-2420(-)
MSRECRSLGIDSRQAGRVCVQLPPAVARHGVDDATRQVVRLQTERDRLVIDVHHPLRLALSRTHTGSRDEVAIGILGEHAGEVRGARELVTARAWVGPGWHAHAREHARVGHPARDRDQIVGHRGAVRANLGEEGALTEIVAAVLLDDDVAVSGALGRNPLEAVDVLEGRLAAADAGGDGGRRIRIVERAVAVRIHALATELDLGCDVALALKRSVDTRDLGGEPGASVLGGREEGGDAGEVVDAEVTAGGTLHDARPAVRVGRVVLGLAAPRRVECRRVRPTTLVPEVEAVRGLVLEVPRAIVHERLHLAIPLPVDRIEAARDGVAVDGDVEVPILLVAAAGGLRDIGGEAIHLAVGEAVAREEVVSHMPRRVAALHADVDACRHDVLGEVVVGAVRPLAHRVLARGLSGMVDTKGAVVARGREAHVVGVAAVDLDDLLEAAKREDAGRVRGLGLQVDHVPGDARVVGARLEISPLLVGDEEVILDAEPAAPLVGLLEVGRAQRLHDPVGTCRGSVARVRAHNGSPARIAAVRIRVRVVRIGRAAVAVPLAWLDQVALQVVGVLDDVARVLNHWRGRFIVGHEAGKRLAIVVNVHDVRTREGGAIGVDNKRVRLEALDCSVRLGLEDDAHRGRIEQVSSHSIGNANKHVAVLRQVLSHGGEDLNRAERIISVAREAVGNDS